MMCTREDFFCLDFHTALFTEKLKASFKSLQLHIIVESQGTGLPDLSRCYDHQRVSDSQSKNPSGLARWDRHDSSYLLQTVM